MFPIDDLYLGTEPMEISQTQYNLRKNKFADQTTRHAVLDSSLYRNTDGSKKAVAVFFSREAIKTLIGNNMPNNPTPLSGVKGLTLTLGLQSNDTTLNLMACSADGNGACPSALQDLNYVIPAEPSPNQNPINITKFGERNNNFRADGYPVLRNQSTSEFTFTNQILFSLLYQNNVVVNGTSKFHYGINDDAAPHHLTLVGNAGTVYREGKPCPPNCYDDM